jgi:[CysO sulfur-carrier protein]-S-L-cysteine hydrolase
VLTILQRVIDTMIAHAREEAPNECCGLLAGRDGRVDECVRTRNLKGSPSEYLVDPADHFAAIRRVRAEGRSIIGAYHSHPRSRAVPSPTDVSEAHYPEFVYVIVSLADAGAPEVRAYRIGNGRFAAVALAPVP